VLKKQVKMAVEQIDDYGEEEDNFVGGKAKFGDGQAVEPLDQSEVLKAVRKIAGMNEELPKQEEQKVATKKEETKVEKKKETKKN
jgi:hypothetical protein